ncbi:MAG: hypothetical protein IPK18_04075 [Sphingobacteriales bacterium]|jgi:hypothetical protein|nr:MAG: hypothetical protein IPK18_04075 [Sphingobacteriales bacterium]
MKNVLFFIQLIFVLIIGGCNTNKNKAERQIVVDDLLGFWKMEDLNKDLCVLWFSPDTLLYFEDKNNRGPRFYKIDSLNNINILDYNKKDSICYINSIKYLDDSILVLENVFSIKELRTYKKFDRVGKELWHNKANNRK